MVLDRASLGGILGDKLQLRQMQDSPCCPDVAHAIQVPGQAAQVRCLRTEVEIIRGNGSAERFPVEGSKSS